MNETEAAELAANYANEKVTELQNRAWKGTGFDGGWIMVPQGEDLSWSLGLMNLVVTDEGTIHEESSSSPPSELVARYQTGGSESQ